MNEWRNRNIYYNVLGGQYNTDIKCDWQLKIKFKTVTINAKSSPK